MSVQAGPAAAGRIAATAGVARAFRDSPHWHVGAAAQALEAADDAALRLTKAWKDAERKTLAADAASAYGRASEEIDALLSHPQSEWLPPDELLIVDAAASSVRQAAQSWEHGTPYGDALIGRAQAALRSLDGAAGNVTHNHRVLNRSGGQLAWNERDAPSRQVLRMVQSLRPWDEKGAPPPELHDLYRHVVAGMRQDLLHASRSPSSPYAQPSVAEPLDDALQNMELALARRRRRLPGRRQVFDRERFLLGLGHAQGHTRVASSAAAGESYRQALDGLALFVPVHRGFGWSSSAAVSHAALAAGLRSRSPLAKAELSSDARIAAGAAAAEHDLAARELARGTRDVADRSDPLREPAEMIARLYATPREATRSS